MSAFRTIRNGHRRLRWSDWPIVGLATLLGPAFLGGILFGVAGPVQSFSQQSNPVQNLIGGIGGLLLMSPILTAFVIPIALLVGAAALRFGWAGWGVAGLVACLGSVLAAAFLSFGRADWTGILASFSILFGAPALLHAAVMWGVLKWRRPEALAPRRP